MERHEHGQPGEATSAIARSKLVLIGFLLIVAYFLWSEHRTHVIAFLPFLLLAACPLMHLFMHGGHGHGHHEHLAAKPDGVDAKENSDATR
ncbi:DUF2933 domain-containing protein [Ralstonia solanacearum]|uniref:DUF2933 domain-containing protein n=1 Tax=Ralstonia solanacearum TaxID=305 RepID=A0A5H2Q7C2_RALSL|nr:DUF2933 domain-containing protein [Ralstonia solanacearum]AYB62510.1 DUF2933 domain-containing protein [Ralstonia solanacearum]MBB6589286.1 DUF2933 domain-containing protein [Ralstonia solanacearum]MCG3577243.1 DUF2933 domain-containing protein [Ralstonia solanacearum]MCL9828158.1 DUF2933 domain-containing protein [Ralstonia solanacearum]MCL9832930.1 DUF2933 domain-containing protein [Ralstonia solanacearum]